MSFVWQRLKLTLNETIRTEYLLSVHISIKKIQESFLGNILCCKAVIEKMHVCLTFLKFPKMQSFDVYKHILTSPKLSKIKYRTGETEFSPYFSISSSVMNGLSSRDFSCKVGKM